MHLTCISWTFETYMQSKIYFVVIKSHWVLNSMMVSGHCPLPNCCLLLYVIVSSVIGLLVYMHFSTLFAIECSFNESSLHITSFPFGIKASKALGISACLMQPSSLRSLYAIYFVLKKELLLNYRPHFGVSVGERKHTEIHYVFTKCVWGVASRL